MTSIYITKTKHFELTKKFADFEELRPNQEIGIDGKQKIITKEESIILFARNRNQIGQEAFLLGHEVKE